MQQLNVKVDVSVDNQICFADACDGIIQALTLARDRAMNHDVIETYGTIENADGVLLGEWSLDERPRRRR